MAEQNGLLVNHRIQDLCPKEVIRKNGHVLLSKICLWDLNFAFVYSVTNAACNFTHYVTCNAHPRCYCLLAPKWLISLFEQKQGHRPK